MSDNKICQICGKELPLIEFYYTHRKDIYPDGRLTVCRDCLTKTIDINNLSSFIHILREIDIPYFDDIWKRMIESYPTASKKGYLGKYIARMKLISFIALRFKDSPNLEELS